MAFEDEDGVSEEQVRIENPGRPRIYDIDIDAYRFATQADVDALAIAHQAFGSLREAYRKTLAQVEVWRESLSADPVNRGTIQ